MLANLPTRQGPSTVRRNSPAPEPLESFFTLKSYIQII